MSTITMPHAIDEAIRECCTEAVNQAVAALAAKYDFDEDEAHEELGELKLARKRGPVPKKSVAKAKATKKDGPKRPKTGYLLFLEHVHDDVKAQLEHEAMAEEEEPHKIQGKEIIAAKAALWKKLDKDEQAEWKARAAAAASSDEEE